MKFRASIILIVILIATTCNAFDGKRKGFVLGGGIGFSPVSHLSGSSPRASKTQSALAFDGLIGKGLAERNVIGIYIDGSYYAVTDIGGLYVTGLFMGPGWRHYSSSKSSSPFIQVAIGWYSFNVWVVTAPGPQQNGVISYWNAAGSGPACNLALGYQFQKNFGLKTGIVFSRTRGDRSGTNPTKASTDHSCLSATLCLLLI